MNQQRGENRIEKLFAGRKEGEKVMSLFLTAGYPDLDSTVDLIAGMAENGTDMIELGMPFSDPLADGPTIQHSSTVAIEKGVTMERIFKMVRQAREHTDIPIILMGYINPVLRFGLEKFCSRASEAGVDGLIIPDIPVEESELLTKHTEKYNLPVIYLVAPNTSDRRMGMIDEKSRGFVYCVSVTGVTGAREGEEVARSVSRFIERVKKNISRNPTMIGFGIKSHEDARSVAKEADGFIVGSALIETIRNHYPDEGWKEQVFAFVRRLKYGNKSN